MLGPCQPLQAVYPVTEHGGKRRSFQPKWFDLPDAKHWLEYSLKADSLFCFACRMFATQSQGDINEQNWMVSGVRGSNWKNAIRAIRKHTSTYFHINNMKSWKCYIKQTPVDCMLSEQRQAELSRRQHEIEFNREVVHRLLDIIIFLAQNNLPFRGHRESESARNRGKFLGLVELQARRDPVLKEHLEKSKQNCHYLSPDIQNEFISLLADGVIDKIIVQVKEAQLFTLLLDETSDISRDEQVSFILRYVNGTGKIEESFIGVVAVRQTDHDTLVSAIKEIFEKHGLSLQNLRGQGYDGAANMSGHYSGVQAMIRKENSKAIYMHCHVHILNLVIVETCSKNNIASNFFGTVQSLYNFIEGSTKRHGIFVDTVHPRLSEPRLSESSIIRMHSMTTPMQNYPHVQAHSQPRYEANKINCTHD